MTAQNNHDWLRWVSFLAAVSILLFFLLNVKYVTGSEIEKNDILVFLLLAILPAIITSLLSLFRKFWWLLPFSVWFGFLGIMAPFDGKDYSEILIVSSVILFFAPFINMALYRKKSVTK